MNMELVSLETNSKTSGAMSEIGSPKFFYKSTASSRQYILQDVPTPSHPERIEACLKEHSERHRNSSAEHADNTRKLEETDNKDDNLSDVQGLMLLIPYYIGMGFLGLPYMVKLIGLWAGLGGILFYGFLNEVCILILVDCTQTLTDRTGKKFGDIVSAAEMSMKLGPACLQPHAGKYKLMVEFALLLNNFLFLTDMLSLMTLFADDLLKEVLELDVQVIMVLTSALLIPVYLAKGMRFLTILSTIGNVVLLGIVAISFQYICHDLPDVKTRIGAKPVNFLAFTTFSNDVMFTLDGIGVVLPVRTRMRETKHFDGWNGVLGVALIFVTCFHAVCGFYGYLKFGEMTHVMYLLNLPLDNWLYKSLKIMFFLSVYCTVGVVVFVPVDVSWRRIQSKIDSEKIRNYGEYVFRFILLIAVCTFTLLVPEFEFLMPFTGCLWTYIGTIIVPASVKIMLMHDEMKPVTLSGIVQRNATLIICYILLIFGIYLTLSGLVVTLYMTLTKTVV